MGHQILERVLDKCIACGGTNLDRKIDFGRQPLANSFLQKASNDLPQFELAVNYCTDCTHVQLTKAVDPDLLYKDYKYVSGTTETLKNHFHEHAKKWGKITSRVEYANRSILDIGCNDGTMLEAFRDVGFEVSGVDPAQNLRKITEEKNIPVAVAYWNSDQAMRHSPKGLITALNCLAHNDNPSDFLLGCRRVTDTPGWVLIEFPYLGATLDTMDLGQFYAEHHSYFTIKSFTSLAERVGMHIWEYEEFPRIHGGTASFTLKNGIYGHSSTLKAAYVRETDNPIEARLETFNTNLEKQVSSLRKSISPRRKYVAYGASAKSSTLFNLEGMKDVVPLISYVVDDSPMKQGLYCPGSNLKIESPEVLRSEDPKNLVILLTVHNFKAEVLERLRKLGMAGATLLNYTPEVAFEVI